jgi:hypothetical protein
MWLMFSGLKCWWNKIIEMLLPYKTFTSAEKVASKTGRMWGNITVSKLGRLNSGHSGG